MRQSNTALKVALAAAEQLPPRLQRELAEHLLSESAGDETRITIHLARMSSQSQARLAELMDKNNDGLLTAAERKELRSLGQEADRVMLHNSEKLARALRPDLFNARGKPIKARFGQL